MVKYSDKLHAIKNPSGKILPWSITYSECATKRKASRWAGWDQAEKDGYKIVQVQIKEIKP